MFEGHRNDAGVLDVRDFSTFVKQSTGVVGYDTVHSDARDGEDRSRELPLPTYWLKEWQEARGILQHIDINESSLTFQGFIVRVPASLSVNLTNIKSLFGQEVSILRTGSPSRIIVQSDGYRGASPSHSNINPSHAGLTKISRGTTSYEPREKNAPETSRLFD